MSDEERRRSVSRERSPAGDRERRLDETDQQQPEEPPKVEFKCFVGGIPWQVNDSGLKESKQQPCTATNFLHVCSMPFY
jgi:hypothetical protein